MRIVPAKVRAGEAPSDAVGFLRAAAGAFEDRADEALHRLRLDADLPARAADRGARAHTAVAVHAPASANTPTLPLVMQIPASGCVPPLLHAGFGACVRLAAAAHARVSASAPAHAAL